MSEKKVKLYSLMGIPKTSNAELKFLCECDESEVQAESGIGVCDSNFPDIKGYIYVFNLRDNDLIDTYIPVLKIYFWKKIKLQQLNVVEVGLYFKANEGEKVIPDKIIKGEFSIKMSVINKDGNKETQTIETLKRYKKSNVDVIKHLASHSDVLKTILSQNEKILEHQIKLILKDDEEKSIDNQIDKLMKENGVAVIQKCLEKIVLEKENNENKK